MTVLEQHGRVHRCCADAFLMHVLQWCPSPSGITHTTGGLADLFSNTSLAILGKSRGRRAGPVVVRHYSGAAWRPPRVAVAVGVSLDTAHPRTFRDGARLVHFMFHPIDSSEEVKTWQVPVTT
jgi:hypothetical protein